VGAAEELTPKYWAVARRSQEQQRKRSPGIGSANQRHPQRLQLYQCHSGDDVLVHFRPCRRAAFASLQEGQTVEFYVTKGPKGFQPENVRPP